MKLKVKQTRTNTFMVYKIPGRKNAVPKKVLESGDIDKLKPYLVRLHTSVKLPSVYNPKFARAFEKIAGCFPDRRIADRFSWKERGLWVICSIEQPCWIVVKLK